MYRSLGLVGAALLASLSSAQASAARPGMAEMDCTVRMTATPTAWTIQGFDPFGDVAPEATFSITYVNDGDKDCRFSPAFELDQPPFGLSSGSGQRIGYVLLDLTDSQDVTPRAGRSVRTTLQREIVLKANQSRTILYKLAVDADKVRDAGTFSQNVIVEARDAAFRTYGGTRLTLGIDVLPSARIGLAGAFTMNDGQAVVDLGELRQGVAPVPLQLRVSSTGRYDLAVSSANSGKLRMDSTQWSVPYSLAIGGQSVNLAGTAPVTGPAGHGYRRESLPIQFIIGDVSNRRAGVYSDIISISVSAR